MKRLSWMFAGLFLVSVASLSFAGCGGGLASYCSARCDCEGCRDGGKECTSDAQGTQKQADAVGCGSFFDDLYSCRTSTSFCNAKAHYETSACDAESKRYENCMNGHK